MKVRDQDRVTAAIEMIGRSGAKSCEVRLSPPEAPDGQRVWLVIADYGDKWDVGAGQSPGLAAERLLDQLLDGGQCQHCRRPTGVAHGLETMPLAEHVCWYQYDPELNTYRRSCEGTPT